MFNKTFMIPALIVASIGSAQAASYRTPSNPNLYNYNIASNQTGQFNYNYIEGDITENSIPGLGKDYSIAGSYSIGPQINLVASYTHTTVHDGDNNINKTLLGAGYHIPVAQDTDATASVHYIDTKTLIKQTGDLYSYKGDNGLGVNVGVRHLFSPVFEGNANLIYDYLGDSQTTIKLGGRYHYTNQLSAGAGFTINKDDDEIGANIRWSF